MPPAQGKEEGSGIEWHKGKEDGSGKNSGYVTGVYIIVKPSTLADNKLRLVLLDKNGALFPTVKVADAKESPDKGGQVLECTFPKIHMTSAWLAGQHQNTAGAASGKRALRERR
jgi:hypothetical protein